MSPLSLLLRLLVCLFVTLRFWVSIKAFNFFSEARCFQSCSWVYIIFSPTAGYSHPGNHIREGHSVEYVVLMVSLDPLSVIECCFYHFLFEYFLPLWAFMFFFFFSTFKSCNNDPWPSDWAWWPCVPMHQEHEDLKNVNRSVFSCSCWGNMCFEGRALGRAAWI